MFKTFPNGLIVACYKSLLTVGHRMCEMRCLCEITKIMVNQSVFVISLKEVMSQHTIRRIYFHNVRSHLMCGLAFRGKGDRY